MRLLVLLAVVLVAVQASGSQEAITGDGREVLLHEDGTWEYVRVDTVGTSEMTTPDDCTQWIAVEEDKLTGNVMVSASAPIVVSEDGGNTGFAILLMRSGNRDGLIFSIMAAGAGACIDEGDGINILFTDGSRLALANDASFNCEPQSTVYFGGIFGKEKELRMLCEKRIETMRVWTSDSYVQRDFPEDVAAAFQHTIHCLNEYE